MTPEDPEERTTVSALLHFEILKKKMFAPVNQWSCPTFLQGGIKMFFV